MHRTLLVAALLAACSPKNPGAYQAATSTGTTGAAKELLLQADIMWAERAQPNKLAEALTIYEKAFELEPRNPKLLLRLTRGWYFHGDAHSSEKTTKIERWEKAITYGKQCLALNEEFASRIAAGEKPKDAITSTTIDDMPCMYWIASAIGKWGKIQGIAKTLGNLPTVKAYVARVEELNPSYFYYGPARYWGTYYAVVPSFAGQDLELSAEYFEKSIAGSPDYLATRGLRAENLAVKLQDVGMFMDDIAFMLDYDVTTIPELMPENTLEKLKAQQLLDRRNELFDKKTIEAYEASPK